MAGNLSSVLLYADEGKALRLSKHYNFSKYYSAPFIIRKLPSPMNHFGYHRIELCLLFFLCLEYFSLMYSCLVQGSAIIDSCDNTSIKYSLYNQSRRLARFRPLLRIYHSHFLICSFIALVCPII